MALSDPDVVLALVDWDAEASSHAKIAADAAMLRGNIDTPAKMPKYLAEGPPSVSIQGADAEHSKVIDQHQAARKSWSRVTQI